MGSFVFVVLQVIVLSPDFLVLEPAQAGPGGWCLVVDSLVVPGPMS